MAESQSLENGGSDLSLSMSDGDTAAAPWQTDKNGDSGSGGSPGDGSGAHESSSFINPQWSKELSKRPLLSRAEERELGRRAQAGDDAAREQFIESNLKLVVSIAKRYRNSGVPMEDLIQEGNMGLVKAVDKFDPGRGCRFSTHAVLWIEGQIRRSIANLRHNVHLPLRVVADLSRLSRVSDELTQKLGQKPTVEDLADSMKAPLGHVKQLMELRPDPASLDDPIDNDLEMFLSDVLEDETAVFPDDFAIRSESARELAACLSALPDRYQTVIRLRYGMDGSREHTLEEIGQKLGLTRQRVRQIEMTALKKMRCMDCPRLHPLATDDVVA